MRISLNNVISIAERDDLDVSIMNTQKYPNLESSQNNNHSSSLPNIERPKLSTPIIDLDDPDVQ